MTFLLGGRPPPQAFSGPAEQVTRYLERNAAAIGGCGAFSGHGGVRQPATLRGKDGLRALRMEHQGRIRHGPHNIQEGGSGKEELAAFERGGAGCVLESEGLGYLPLHQVDTSRIDARKAYALHRATAKMDMGI